LSGIRGRLKYGVSVFLEGSLPIFVLTFASFWVSQEFILSWVAQYLSQYVSANYRFATINESHNHRQVAFD